MKIQAVMLTVLMLGGCGTVQTVVLSDKASVDQLKTKKSYCGAVPRIYSGATYDFCMLHAEKPDDVDAFNYNNASLGWWSMQQFRVCWTHSCCPTRFTSNRPMAVW